jgi:DnaJ like chaperone protein
MILLVTISALIGLWLGGAKGFIVGFGLGFALAFLARAVVRRKLLRLQADFLETTFAAMGAICKADGVVTREEIQVVEEVFVRLRLSPEAKQTAKAAFNRGKLPDFDLDAAVQRFAQTAALGGILSQLFLQLQLMAVAADGHVHPDERAMLVRVASLLGLAERDVAKLEALLRAAAGGQAAPGGAAHAERLEDAYAALGLTPEASEVEIKRTYRKMMSENHPDKIAGKGLPESMRSIAEERAREINVAYDLIRNARQFG